MEEELRAALTVYQENLVGVQAVLQQLPDNAEALELQEELQAAIAATQEALSAQACSGAAADVPHVAEAAAAAAASGAETHEGHSAPAGEAAAAHAEHIGPHLPEQPPPSPRKRRRPGDADGPADGATTAAARPRAGGNNARIHPRSRYAAAEPDFAALAARHPSLQPHLVVRRGGRPTIDFADEDAARELTKVLLADDFGLSWWVPSGQLVPPLTNRANYIHWIEDLLQLSAPQGLPHVRGLDVGCGANCIYPLLGAALQPSWHWVAVDLTDVALEWAQRNVAANPQLGRRVVVRRSGGDAGCPKELLHGASGILLPAIARGERFSFSMCNPPFFGSLEEASANPNTAYSGSAEEMVYPGGEMAFVGAMVADSAVLRGAVHWYSSMVGKKSSLKALRKLLYEKGVTALRTTEFCQGHTSRWGIAWSFTVDPNLSRVPLPGARAAATAEAQRAAAPANGSVAGAGEYGFSVAAGRGQRPLQLLRLLASVLGAHGAAGVEVEAAGLCLRGELQGGSAGDDGLQAGAEPDDRAARSTGDLGEAAEPCRLTARLHQSEPGQFSVKVSASQGGAGQHALRRLGDVMPLVEADVRQIWVGM